MVSFGDLGSLIDIGTLPCRWRSKVDCIQDAVDPLSEQIRTPLFRPGHAAEPVRQSTSE